MADDLGLYISVPFCQAKCSFCNFASDRFPATLLPTYIDRLIRDLGSAPQQAERLGADLPRQLTSIYFGGGTPSLLQPAEIYRLFEAIDRTWHRDATAEITIECAPGQLTPASLHAFQACGVNRLSFGVQSFIDAEAAAVGRTHTGRQCRAEIARAQHAGIADVGVDLIAGLPHQTEASWRTSLRSAIAAGVSHVSVYLLEIDDGSRLGREALAGGSRYGALALPSDDLAATLYEFACAELNAAGIEQYEISNFARPGFRSRHNQRYWARTPYLGLGLDAHSMLRDSMGRALRFATPDTMEAFLGTVATSPLPLLPQPPDPPHTLSLQEELEETLFLGLRRVAGVPLAALAQAFPPALLAPLEPIFQEAREEGLLEADRTALRLTPRGRLLSNDLFSRFLTSAAAHAA